jgi:hypothetical protein
MSTINTVSTASNQYATPNTADVPTTTATNFSQVLSTTQVTKSLLSTHESSLANRPDIKEFMDRTGADSLDASELLYGVVGSNTDVRDWSAIMSSSDPVTAARQATGQMYGRTDISKRTDAVYATDNDTLAKDGNFLLRQLKDDAGKVLDQGLKLTDAQGLLLRDAGSSPQAIARNAWLFGFDTQPLVKLADAALTISKDLGNAISKASTVTATTTMAPIQKQTLEFTSAVENVNSTVPNGIATSATQLPVNAPYSLSKVDSQATSPTLSQAIEEATNNATSSFVDSATYLNSLFQA